MPCCGRRRNPNVSPQFSHQFERKAGYLESSCLPCSYRNKNFLKKNGRLATSVGKAQSYFRNSNDARKQLNSLEKYIVTCRNSYLKGLEQYKITAILVDIERKEPTQEMFKLIRDELKQDMQAVIHKGIQDTGEESTEFSALKMNLNTMISIRKVKNLVRSDLVEAVKLFIKESNSPKSMQFINEFIKFLLKNNDIKDSDYTDLRKIVRSQIEIRMKQILKDSTEIDKDDNDVNGKVETFIIKSLSNLENYKNILLKNQHSHCKFRRFISSRLMSSYPKNLIDTADKIFAELMEKAIGRIHKALATKSLSNPSYTISIEDFKKLSTATCLAMSLLIDPALRKYQEPIFKKLFVDTANWLTETLSAAHSPLGILDVQSNLIRILQQNKILQQIDHSYLDVEQLFNNKKLDETVEYLNKIIEEQTNKKHQVTKGTRTEDLQKRLKVIQFELNQFTPTSNQGKQKGSSLKGANTETRV